MSTYASRYANGLAVDAALDLASTAVGWKDITSDIVLRGSQVVDPTWAQIGASPFWGYQFALTKQVWTTFHINHDYVAGGAIHLHAHWLSAGVDVTNPVKWRFVYSIVKGHNQAVGGTLDLTGTTVDVSEVSGGAYRHMITETPVTLDVTHAEPDSLILVTVQRVTNGATDNTDAVFLMMCDCHYEASRLATPNKNPDFYI